MTLSNTKCLPDEQGKELCNVFCELFGLTRTTQALPTSLTLLRKRDFHIIRALRKEPFKNGKNLEGVK